MSYDMNCPYCDAEVEVCHDDGFGYEEGVSHEMECPECEKNFVFFTEISFSYEPHRADCLNGGEHNMKKLAYAPECYPDWSTCTECGKEDRGEYKKDAYR
jgi:hypothetical protein